jgi:hypothetical protein
VQTDISPEPEPLERAAIEQALSQLDDGPPAAVTGGWSRAGAYPDDDAGLPRNSRGADRA